jgi:hypothetical protein
LYKLIQLPAALAFSAQQLAGITRAYVQQESGHVRQILVALLALPAAQQFDPDVAQGLLFTALERGSVQAVDVLCQHLPACAAAWQHMDSQLLLQRLEALLCNTASGVNRLQQVHSFLTHPSLQQHVEHLLPGLLLSAFAKGCRHWQPGSGRFAADELQVPLQLPAAQTLSSSVLRQLMQLSILRMDGALLPELVRHSAAAQLQQDDVSLVLQAALEHPYAGDSGITGAAARHAAFAPSSVGEAAVMIMLEGQQGAPPQQQESLTAHYAHPHQQGQQRNDSEGQQEHACTAQGLPGRSSSVPSVLELLQECLQSPQAVAYMFQLSMLPWVQQLPAVALKGLLLAAGEYQFKAMFHELLQLPQVPRDDAEVQEATDLLAFSACAVSGDPYCYVPRVFSMPSWWGVNAPKAFSSESDDEGV